ncbi:Uncharacterized conserved protein YndB, AHSA1/START domain [Propionibacterium cyclohexanicum]|uniref:Uncharacterized conserved protein YndB, AHSA1/START domain n=1 Tax=Propionibacterium cyclohexanicum TaxID=64702 RepID=A0A1H9RHK7_9ACTN|nr:SRPBCC family protein [Propionibacterium cyclohexanicum]SER71459.1 Uncharacterized conserved protein YndB, AHSA1/START domain [Propionibacterium cyclohexanicum]
MPTDKLVTAETEIAAPAGVIFEFIADPARQPSWDGNDNLESADPGQRIYQLGESFVTLITSGDARENHIVEFEEGRRIAWCPGPVGGAPFGQLWRWELEPIDADHTLVRHSYDWSGLPPSEEARRQRAARTRPENLQASLTRLKALSETSSE